MSSRRDINERYVDAIRQNNDRSFRPTVTAPEERLSPGQRVGRLLDRVLPPSLRRLAPAPLAKALRAVGAALQIAALLAFGGGLLLFLRLRAWLRGSEPSAFTRDAMGHVRELISQYPMHLYPVLAKAGEFAFLESRLSAAVARGDRILEVAIGDGSFSQRLFPPTASVIGLDLNPYSLCKAVGMRHVERAVIADCTNPPVRPGAFDLLLANNFLHHVTDKEPALASWSRIATQACFNENTGYWASSFFVPFVLGRLGFAEAAARETERIEATHWQHLWTSERLDDLVKQHFSIAERRSFMSEKTFFLCAAFSWLMAAYGPPTPPILKRAMNWFPLRGIVHPLTEALARALLEYDESQDRTRDVFVCYLCDAGVQPDEDARAHPFACPDCGGAIGSQDRCSGCGRAYLTSGGMLFVLPKTLDDVRAGYDQALAESLTDEQL
jgi:SAM-dependent methyltransferase